MLMYRRVRADNPRGVADDAVPADVKAHVLAQLAKAKAAGPSAGAVCAPCGPVYGPVCRKPAVTRPNAKAPTCVISADDGIRVTGDSRVVDDDGDDGEQVTDLGTLIDVMNAEAAEEGGADATAPTADGGADATAEAAPTAEAAADGTEPPPLPPPPPPAPGSRRGVMGAHQVP